LEENRQQAFENLNRAMTMGFRNVEHLRKDADLRTLRRDARWKALLKMMERLACSQN
jgi:hypothetical protein